MDSIQENRLTIIRKFERLVQRLEDEGERAAHQARMILRAVMLHEDADQLATVFRGIMNEFDRHQERIDDRPRPLGPLEQRRLKIIHYHEQLVGRLDEHDPEAVTEAQTVLANLAQESNADQLARWFRGIVHQFHEDERVMDNTSAFWGPFVRELATFSEALAALRESGGAMHYRQATRQEPSYWIVGPCDEIAETTGYSPHKCTVNALRRGGMSDEQITAELAAWEDPRRDSIN